MLLEHLMNSINSSSIETGCEQKFLAGLFYTLEQAVRTLLPVCDRAVVVP